MKSIKHTNIQKEKNNNIDIYLIYNIFLILLIFVLIVIIDEMYKRSISISKFDNYFNKQNI